MVFNMAELTVGIWHCCCVSDVIWFHYSSVGNNNLFHKAAVTFPKWTFAEASAQQMYVLGCSHIWHLLNFLARLHIIQWLTVSTLTCICPPPPKNRTEHFYSYYFTTCICCPPLCVFRHKRIPFPVPQKINKLWLAMCLATFSWRTLKHLFHV